LFKKLSDYEQVLFVSTRLDKNPHNFDAFTNGLGEDLEAFVLKVKGEVVGVGVQSDSHLIYYVIGGAVIIVCAIAAFWYLNSKINSNNSVLNSKIDDTQVTSLNNKIDIQVMSLNNTSQHNHEVLMGKIERNSVQTVENMRSQINADATILSAVKETDTKVEILYTIVTKSIDKF
jgi:uncharacterized membrane protein YhiD involved in acid resistance